MSLPASTRDLAKAIGSYIPTATLPLPDDLTQIIEAYLDKHEKYDEGAAERLHDELVSIYHKTVEGNPALYAPFLAILRQLRPSIKSQGRVVEWLDVLLEPVLGHLGLEKGLANEAVANVIDILTADNYEDESAADPASRPSPIAVRLLERWMHLFHVSQPEGNSAELFKEKLMRDALLAVGKKRPQAFLTALDTFLVKREFRSRTFTILCDFVQSQPPHLYVVLETPLFANILACLQNDTSTTVVTMALTALTMLLPNMPSSLVPFLPTLFNVYARLLFWDRERSMVLENDPDSERRNSASSPEWELCTFSPDTDGPTIPNLLNYFTILYGLYPLNFMDYIRKPQRYLRHADAPNPDDVEIQPSEIRHKSERFRVHHMLHPNFYSATVESEKTDFARWNKSEPAEVVAECMALRVTSEAPTEHTIRAGAAVLERSPSRDVLLAAWHTQSAVGSPTESRPHSTLMRRTSQSSHDPSLRDSLDHRHQQGAGESPTLQPQLALSPSQTQLQDMINSNKAIKSGLHQSLANDSVPSLSLSHPESVPERPTSKHPVAHLQTVVSPTSPARNNAQVSQLYKQILLLNNDLNFERYMKQQHMIHIGELRRRQLREAASEAETQNLLMTNRTLKHRFEEAKRAELQAKKEAENRRVLAKKWETDLSAKLRHLREEQKKWSSEGAALRRELEAKKEECLKLTKMVCEFETRELNARQHLQSVDVSVGETERLRAEVQRLMGSERDYQAKEREIEGALLRATEAVRASEILRMKLDARDAEVTKTRELYQRQIDALNKQLQEALGRRGRPGRDDDASAVEGALAASRTRQAELQKQYGLLMRRYTVLQTSLLDMTASANQARGRAEGVASSASADADADVSAIVGSSMGLVRTRSHRPVSNFDDSTSSLSNSLALDTSTGTSAGTVVHRPLTPPSAGPSEASKTSPTTERYYGRGGVQNTLRKDKKEKKKEDGERKKVGGIRGIRGFV